MQFASKLGIIKPSATPTSAFRYTREVLKSIALCVGLFAAASSNAEIYYVGSGGFPGGCASLDIAGAINASYLNAGTDEIRITDTFTSTEDILIDGAEGNEDLIISGGWSDCMDSSQSGIKTLVGNNDGILSTVRVVGDAVAGSPNVTLRNLRIWGWSSQYGINVTEGAAVTLENSEVYFSFTGINVTEDATVTINADSSVRDNNATLTTFGGGVTCGSSAAASGGKLNVYGRIYNNSAQRGGGIHALSDCEVRLFDGASIDNNDASSWGGGLMLEDEALLIAGFGAANSVQISDNTAGEGGGLYLRDPNAEAFLANVHVTDNSASLRGGGVRVTDSAFLRMDRWNSGKCTTGRRCTVLSRNQLTDGAAFGIAAFVSDSAEAIFNQVYVEENVGADQSGRLFHAEDDGTSMTLEQVQIWNNDAEYLISSTGADVTGAYISAARNRVLVTGTTFSDSFGATGPVDLHASIFDDVIGFGSPVTGRCMLVEFQGLMTGSSILVGADPLFNAAGNGDLNLLEGSPAIDVCDTAGFAPTQRDLNLEPRGHDDPDVPNSMLGVFDLGAFEATLIFEDGFESGNLFAWSSSSP